MSNVIELREGDYVRSAIADEVRAYMARRRVSAAALGRATGTTQQYWSRRLTGLTAFDTDDLANLSRILQVPMAAFLPFDEPLDDAPETKKAPTPKSGGRKLPELDSNQQPAGFKPAGELIPVDFSRRSRAVAV